MDFIGGDAWMNAMYGDIFRLLMVQSELAGARMASRNSSCIHRVALCYSGRDLWRIVWSTATGLLL